MECYNCGEEYKSIGRHWGLSDCPHKPFTDFQREVITGLLMSDGWIHRSTSESRNPRFECEMITEEYIKYLDEVFDIHSLGYEKSRTAEEAAFDVVERGFYDFADAENYSDAYRFSTRRHPELKEFNGWYEPHNSQRRKVWPCDSIKLTSTVLKNLYVGDGCWDNTNGKNRITISMAGQIGHETGIRNMFQRAGFEEFNLVKRYIDNGDEIMQAEFTVEESKKMWNYMGEALPGFEYKWPDKYCNGGDC